MGLFYNYGKPGPGVSKNEREKKRFFLFFELFGRKFSKLISLNLIYFITLIPLFLGLLLSFKLNPQILSDGVFHTEAIGNVPVFVPTGDIIGIALIFVSLFLTAPATCGFTYVIRNMQRQEHAWIFSDFREHFAKNFKQAFVLGVIDVAVTVILYFAYTFYAYSMPLISPDNAIISTVGSWIVLLASLFFVIMHYYIYVMMVTFDLSIKNIFKNAAIFTISMMPLNLFITAIVGLVVLLSVIYVPIGIVCAMGLSLSFCGFVIVFSVYPTIDKYMISVQESNETPQVSDEERDFVDTVR